MNLRDNNGDGYKGSISLLDFHLKQCLKQMPYMEFQETLVSNGNPTNDVCPWRDQRAAGRDLAPH